MATAATTANEAGDKAMGVAMAMVTVTGMTNNSPTSVVC